MPYCRVLSLAALLLMVTSPVSAGSLFRMLRPTDPPALHQAVAAQNEEQSRPIAVPEPTTIAVTGAGLASLLLIRHMRRLR